MAEEIEDKPPTQEEIDDLAEDIIDDYEENYSPPDEEEVEEIVEDTAKIICDLPYDEEDVEEVEDWIIECVDDEDKIEEVAEEICNKPVDEDHVEDVLEEVVEEVMTCDEVCRTATVCGEFDENDLPEDACLSCSAPDEEGNFVCTLMSDDESTEDDASFEEEASEMLMDAMH